MRAASSTRKGCRTWSTRATGPARALWRSPARSGPSSSARRRKRTPGARATPRSSTCARADMILDIQQRGAAAWLWMNRPEARNALSDELLAALETALDVLEKDAGARARVLARRGPAVCAGGDLAKMEKAAKMTRARSRREASRFAKLLYRLHVYPKPIVARVHGPAFAGGMGLVAACDLGV